MRKFINGPLEGTNVEIMPSKAATQLPNGAPIKEFAPTTGYNATQTLHAEGQVDVHARQYYTITFKGTHYNMVGPTIAQQWKSEAKAALTNKGWTARYYRFEGDSE